MLSRHDAVTWLPDLDVDRWESLPAPNYRSDYVRSRVLQRYGGVWMDVDTVALSPLSQLIGELDGTGMVCFGKEYGRFFGGLCAAAPGSPFVDAWVEGQDRALSRRGRLVRAPLRCPGPGRDVGDRPSFAVEGPPHSSAWRPCPGTSGGDSSRGGVPRRLLPESPITVVLWNAVMAPRLRVRTRTELLAGRALLSRLLRIGLGISPMSEEDDAWTRLHALSALRFSLSGQRLESGVRRASRRRTTLVTADVRVRGHRVGSLGGVEPVPRPAARRRSEPTRRRGLGPPPRISKYASDTGTLEPPPRGERRRPARTPGGEAGDATPRCRPVRGAPMSPGSSGRCCRVISPWSPCSTDPCSSTWTTPSGFSSPGHERATSRHRPPGGVRLGRQRLPGRLVRVRRPRRRAGVDGDRHRALHPGLTPRRSLRGGLDGFGCRASGTCARSPPPWHAFSPRHPMPGSWSWPTPSSSSRGFPSTGSISCRGARRRRPASSRDSTSASCLSGAATGPKASARSRCCSTWRAPCPPWCRRWA